MLHIFYCLNLILLSLSVFPIEISAQNTSHYSPMDISEYRLQTKSKIKEVHVKDIASAWVVDKENFPALDGVTCYALELWDESMRLPHWHPNASELGYVVSGQVEIILWRSPGESSAFTVGEGMCWFIPKGALHCLNNLGKEKAQMLVGFSGDQPQDIDLPVAMNGLPIPLRNAYTSPHTELKTWTGVIKNPLVAKYEPNQVMKNLTTGSTYKFDLAQVTPLFSDKQLGAVVWSTKDNWSILKDISMMRAQLNPGIARDAIWYPDAGTLYIVTKGKGTFHIIIPDHESNPLEVNLYDYVFIPMGTLHTFINSSSNDFEVVAFFTKENPLPEVSLSVATSFFPNTIRKLAMTEYGNVQKDGDPLKNLKFSSARPYLIKVPTQKAEIATDK